MENVIYRVFSNFTFLKIVTELKWLELYSGWLPHAGIVPSLASQYPKSLLNLSVNCWCCHHRCSCKPEQQLFLGCQPCWQPLHLLPFLDRHRHQRDYTGQQPKVTISISTCFPPFLHIWSPTHLWNVSV